MASMASAASARSGGVALRWMAASSYSPITWLVTTTSAGTSASRPLALAAGAASASSISSSSSLVGRRSSGCHRWSRLVPYRPDN